MSPRVNCTLRRDVDTVLSSVGCIESALSATVSMESLRRPKLFWSVAVVDTLGGMRNPFTNADLEALSNGFDLLGPFAITLFRSSRNLRGLSACPFSAGLGLEDNEVTGSVDDNELSNRNMI